MTCHHVFAQGEKQFLPRLVAMLTSCTLAHGVAGGIYRRARSMSSAGRVMPYLTQKVPAVVAPNLLSVIAMKVVEANGSRAGLKEQAGMLGATAALVRAMRESQRKPSLTIISMLHPPVSAHRRVDSDSHEPAMLRYL